MKLRALVIVAAAAFVLPVQAQQGSGQQQAEPPKTEAKAPATLAGKWNMSINSPQGAMESALELKQDGKKITGTIVTPQGTTELEGEFAEGKLVFAIYFEAGGGAMEIWFSGALKEDGTLAGSLDVQGSQIPWTAQRVKGA
jgi:hypothetical protein